MLLSALRGVQSFSPVHPLLLSGGQPSGSSAENWFFYACTDHYYVIAEAFSPPKNRRTYALFFLWFRVKWCVVGTCSLEKPIAFPYYPLTTLPLCLSDMIDYYTYYSDSSAFQEEILSNSLSFFAILSDIFERKFSPDGDRNFPPTATVISPDDDRNFPRRRPYSWPSLLFQR